MDWKQEQQVIKYLNNIKDELDIMDNNIGHIKEVSKHMRNAKIDILYMINLFKEHHSKDGKEETVQHRNEGQNL